MPNKTFFQSCTSPPDLRWCSDSLKVRCWNCEKVHLTFVPDCWLRHSDLWVDVERARGTKRISSRLPAPR